MSTENGNTAVSLALTREMIYGAATPRNVIELPAVKDNWIKQYALVTGRQDGPLKYEAERVMFLQTVAESPKLQQCDLMSLYSAWIELSVSGLSLRDGLSYITPYKGKAEWQPGWKGRLEQINQLPHVQYIDEPILVYDCDKFVYTRGEETRIREHVPKFPRPAKAEILFVYLTLTLTSGQVKVHLMDRDEVIGIRNRYSETYKSYLKKKAANAWEDWMDGGIWVTNEAQAWRKTLVKRVYNNGPKLPHHKLLDARIKERESSSAGYELEDYTSAAPNAMSAAFSVEGNDVVDTTNGQVVGTKEPATEDATYTEVTQEQAAPPVQQTAPPAQQVQQPESNPTALHGNQAATQASPPNEPAAPVTLQPDASANASAPDLGFDLNAAASDGF